MRWGRLAFPPLILHARALHLPPLGTTLALEYSSVAFRVVESCSIEGAGTNAEEEDPYEAHRRVQGQDLARRDPGARDRRRAARRHQLHPNQTYTTWKREVLENAERVFERDDGAPSASVEREKELLQKIGELTVERDFLSRGLGRSR